MVKIPFLTDFYYPETMSIGMCVKKLAEEFIDSKNDVHVLCFGKR